MGTTPSHDLRWLLHDQDGKNAMKESGRLLPFWAILVIGAVGASALLGLLMLWSW
jgi:hypothetical protein